MALPVSVPYAFANATTTQNLAYLDSNFNTLSYTLNGIGNGTVSLANVSITGGTISANVSATSIYNGTSNVSVDSANGPVSINTNGSNAMYIDASQNVGIGTTSPSTYDSKLSVFNGNFSLTTTTNKLYLYYASATNYANLSTAADGSITFTTGTSSPSERMRIDSSGNVGIGTTSPATKLQVYKPSVSTFTGTSLGGIVVTDSNSTLNYYSAIDFNTQSNNALSLARIAMKYTGGGSYLNFGTSNNYTNGITNTAMSIDPSGNLLVGYTASNGAYKLQVNSQIFATSATIATSDANYKTNVTSLSGALSLVQKLNPVSFNWKKHPVHNFDTETPTVGFLAQEVQTAFADTDYVNSIVKESEVTLPDDTKEKFLGIAEGNMIALLTKAIQELSTEVTALKAKVGQ